MMGVLGAWIARGIRPAGALAAAVSLAAVSMLGGCALTTPTIAEVEQERVKPAVTADALVEEGVLTVAMDTAVAPQAMTSSDGTPQGYYADVARALAEDMGLDLKVVPAASARASVAEGTADIYIGSLASEAGDDLVVTGALLDNAPSLFTMAGEGDTAPSTPDVTALSGSVIAVQDASASQDALAHAGVEVQQRTFANVNECFEALAAGDVDYVACDATAGSYLARAYEGAAFVGTIGPVSSWGIAMSADGGEFGMAFPGVFEGLLSDGTIAAIHRAWYGDLPMTLSDTLLSGIDLDAPASKKDEEGEEGNAASAEDGASAEGDVPMGE